MVIILILMFLINVFLFRMVAYLFLLLVYLVVVLAVVVHFIITISLILMDLIKTWYNLFLFQLALVKVMVTTEPILKMYLMINFLTMVRMHCFYIYFNISLSLSHTHTHTHTHIHTIGYAISSGRFLSTTLKSKFHFLTSLIQYSIGFIITSPRHTEFTQLGRVS